jgi:prepilin-type N-terminal cleavage/methylation domain-containing protein
MILKPDSKENGFSLIEVILGLVVAAILSAMVVQFFGTSLTNSAVPVGRLSGATNFEQVMENIITDYKRGSVWLASTAYSVNDIAASSTREGYYYKCTSSGTSDSTEPDWLDSGWPIDGDGNRIVSDGGVTWLETPVLSVLKEKIGTEGATLSNSYGDYTVVYNRYIKFVASGGNFEEADISGGDPQDLLKVTIQDDLGEILTVILTASFS